MAVSQTGTSYELTGPEGAPVVALIHGLGMDRHSTWAPIAPVLAEQYRVLSYDLCGHGATALPEQDPSLTVLSEQLISLMDELGIEQAALVGFSLGGMINRRCAIDHPDRVSAVAILNSPHERGEEAQKRFEEYARQSGEGGPGATIDAALERWFTEGFHCDHPDQVASVRDVILANDHKNYAQHRQVLAEGVVELIRPEPPITHPALVMTCEFDSGSTPAMSWAIAKEIGEADVVIVPELKHLGLVEQPKLFSDPVMAFLARVLG